MGVVLLMLAYLALAADPCNAPAEHDLLAECWRSETPVFVQSRSLDQYARAEFGILQLRRVEPVLPSALPLLPDAAAPSRLSDAWQEVGGSVCVVLGYCDGGSDGRP